MRRRINWATPLFHRVRNCSTGAADDGDGDRPPRHFRTLEEEMKSRGHEGFDKARSREFEKYGVTEDLWQHPEKIVNIPLHREKNSALKRQVPDPQPPSKEALPDSERRGEAQQVGTRDSMLDEERYWRGERREVTSGKLYTPLLSPDRKTHEGMAVTELKFPPKPGEDWFKLEEDNFFRHPELLQAVTDEAGYDEVRQLAAPPPFDPALDDVEERELSDWTTVADIEAAAEFDRRRLEAFGNPMTLEDQMDYLLMPTREGYEQVQQRKDFNGFQHWGLLPAAYIAMDEQQDFRRAHSYVSRYLRDIDLFAKWLDHPKVNAHFKKKFNIEIKEKYDKMAAMSLALYVRSKIEVLENDSGAAIKSLTASLGLLNERADLHSNERHKKLYGAVLAARGMVFCQAKSYQRSVDDFSRAMKYLPINRAATLFQLRAESYEGLGLLDEARADELAAADIWERADTIYEGLDGTGKKFVL